MMSESPLLVVKNISFSINNNRLFHNLSLILNEGKAIYIKGDNGSGKSTFLRILLGITPAKKGNVIWKENTPKVFLGHKNILKNYLTVADNLYMHGIDLHDNETKETLKKLNLHRKIDLIVGNLSYGQQKKLALVRIFLNKSKVLLLDEPCVGLDNATKSLITEFLNAELQKKKSIIFTSHIPINVENEEILLGSN